MSALAQLSDELEGLVARTAPAVASVAHRRGSGSAVALAPDGYLLTNAHVVRGARELRVRLQAGGLDLKGIVLGSDDRTDLAVVQVETQSERLPVLPLDEARQPGVGALVVAIGNPLALERSVSVGIISAVERTLPLPRRGGLLEGLIQTDAAINPGNSGGPLVNARGQVVGICTAVMAYAQGIGFAIPARTASWVACELIRAGRVTRPKLGIAARGHLLAANLARSVGQRHALRVYQVSAGSAAAEAGLCEGDLLLSANDRELANVDDLQRVMVLGRPEALALNVWRAGALERVCARPRRAA